METGLQLGSDLLQYGSQIMDLTWSNKDPSNKAFSIFETVIYSLVEQFFETHFHKSIYRGKGILYGKFSLKFSGLWTLTWGEGYIIRATNPFIKWISQDIYWCKSSIGWNQITLLFLLQLKLKSAKNFSDSR